MLNISKNKLDIKIDQAKFRSFSMLKEYKSGDILTRILMISFLLFGFTILLPWTQNIRSKGYITTLQPDQRPQTINSMIDGKIEKWFVREGTFVNKGDTIVFVSEIKDKFLDPKLLDRTEAQIQSKELVVKSYMEKVKALDSQIDALLKTKKLKIEQTNNSILQTQLKIKSDSMNLIAAETNYQTALQRAQRMEQLYKDGLKSLTDLEARRLKLQETEAKKVSLSNQLLTRKNELLNGLVELNSIENQYKNKLAKAESDKYAALSGVYEAEAVVTKMQNQYMNYSVRSGMYYITAPQAGYVTTMIRSGIGETVKAGEKLISIMPSDFDLAVAMYIRPMDLPLINKGQEVRFLFDGWPAIVFSGWPTLSYGTFGGEVVAIDNFISPNGKYRILVAPSERNRKWPAGLRVGSGANGMALLKDVPIWYELWRNLNGFPPDYYEGPIENVTEPNSKK